MRLRNSESFISRADLDGLEARLGYQFQNEALLVQALTHRTWLKEHQDRYLAMDLEDQQRLEFLGDAFLGYSAARRLFDRHPGMAEGELTSQRVRLIEGGWLDQVGKALQVDRLILLGRGEEAMRGRNERLRKDTVEALIGAVLLDGGEAAAHQLIDRLMPLEAPLGHGRDPIIAFGEAYQRQFRHNPPEPSYRRAGTDHQPLWTAELTLEDGTVVTGTHSNKQEAKREACRQALLQM